MAPPTARGRRDDRPGGAGHPRTPGGDRRADRVSADDAAGVPVDRRRPRSQRRARAQRVHADLLSAPRAESHRFRQLLAHRHPRRPSAPPRRAAAAVSAAAGPHRHLGPLLPPRERPRDLRVQHPPELAPGDPPVRLRTVDRRPRRRVAGRQRRRRDRRLQRERRRYRDLAHRDRPGLRDAWLAADRRQGPPFTSNGFGPPPPHDEVWRIDWILVGGPLVVRTARTVLHDDDGRYPSDHYPVAARLDWPREPAP